MGIRKRLHKEAVIMGIRPPFISRYHQHIYSLTWGHCLICGQEATDQPMDPKAWAQVKSKFFPAG